MERLNWRLIKSHEHFLASDLCSMSGRVDVYHQKCLSCRPENGSFWGGRAGGMFSMLAVTSAEFSVQWEKRTYPVALMVATTDSLARSRRNN